MYLSGQQFSTIYRQQEQTTCGDGNKTQISSSRKCLSVAQPRSSDSRKSRKTRVPRGSRHLCQLRGPAPATTALWNSADNLQPDPPRHATGGRAADGARRSGPAKVSAPPGLTSQRPRARPRCALSVAAGQLRRRRRGAAGRDETPPRGTAGDRPGKRLAQSCRPPRPVSRSA